jgi:hypothetical protein
MATARRASVPAVEDAHRQPADPPPAFEPAIEISLKELRKAERDPKFKAFLKEAVELRERVKREGRLHR